MAIMFTNHHIVIVFAALAPFRGGLLFRGGNLFWQYLLNLGACTFMLLII